MTTVFGQPTRRRSHSSHLEERLAAYIASARLPRPVREFKFAAPARQWRFDFAWPDRGLALEVEGGTFVNGAHSRGRGMREDAEKYNAAAIAGWHVLRVTTDMFRDGSAFQVVQRALATAIRYQPTVLPTEGTRDV